MNDSSSNNAPSKYIKDKCPKCGSLYMITSENVYSIQCGCGQLLFNRLYYYRDVNGVMHKRNV